MFLVRNYQLKLYICVVKVETNNLMTIKNFAMKEKVTASYIYKLIKEEKMQSMEIDGVQFIDTAKYPSIPAKRN